MGISWDDEVQVAYAVLVLPDGRIVCQKPSGKSSIGKWQATAYRVMNDKTPIEAATHIIDVMFHLKIPKSNCIHMISYFSEVLKKRLEVVVCKIKSGESIVIPSYMTVCFKDYNTLIRDMVADQEIFTPDTVQAINLLDGMTRFGRK